MLTKRASGNYRPHDGTLLPGSRLTVGLTLAFLVQLVALPALALATKASSLSWRDWIRTIGSERVLAAFRVSLVTSGVAALCSSLLGVLLAWVMVRYRFPGRRLLDALVDLPLALPTAVAGLALTALYAQSGPEAWLGSQLAKLGIQVAYTPLGIVMALIFVGLPLQVRVLQPVMRDLTAAPEEAARLLGASPRQIFLRVILPELRTALIVAFSLAFSRGLGEYGSVVFIAGNFPGVSEIVPLIITTKLEQFDYAGATAVAVAMMSVSFGVMMLMNRLSFARPIR